MAHLIGIGGASRSGKSSLALKLKDRLPQKRVLLLDVDDFVFPEADISKIRDRTDWERPESIDFDRILQTIQDNRRSYDFIVIEGILAFASKKLTSIYNYSIWLQISKEIFLKRRKKETRWGDEPDWYLEHVWKSYLQYGQYPDADLILSGETEIQENIICEIVHLRT